MHNFEAVAVAVVVVLSDRDGMMCWGEYDMDMMLRGVEEEEEVAFWHGMCFFFCLSCPGELMLSGSASCLSEYRRISSVLGLRTLGHGRISPASG